MNGAITSAPGALNSIFESLAAVCRDRLGIALSPEQLKAAVEEHKKSGKTTQVYRVVEIDIKSYRLYYPYKGSTAEHRSSRELIVRAVEEAGLLRLADQSLHEAILWVSPGDALDSVIAAFATARALSYPIQSCPTSRQRSPY